MSAIRWEMQTMRSSIAFAVVLLATSAGCAYVPPLSHQYNAGDLKRLVPGRTTRAQAERLLRSPQRLQVGDRILVCEQSRHAGYVAVAGMGGGAAGSLVTQRYRILLEFDSTQVLQRLEVEPKRREGGVVPGVDTTRGAFPSPVESLFVRRSWPDPPLAFTHLSAARSGLLAGLDSHGSLWAWSKQANGPPYHVVLPRRGPIRAIALAPDGRHVACLSKDLAFVELPSWDFASGGSAPLVATWTSRDARAMALAPDGAYIAMVGRRGTLTVLDSRDGHIVNSFSIAKDHRVVALAWSPDARRLTALEERGPGYSLTFHALDSPEVETPAVPIGPTPEGTVPAIAFSPDGRWIAVNRGTHVELWKVADTSGVAPPASLEDAFLLPYAPQRPEGGAGALSLSFDPGSTMLVAGNGRALAFALDGSRRRWRDSAQTGSAPFVRDLVVDPADGRLVGSTTRGLFTWDLPAAEVMTSAP